MCVGAVPSYFLKILDQNIPYYLIVDGSNTIVKSGPALTLLLREDIEGRCLTEAFKVHGATDVWKPASSEEVRSTAKLSSRARGIVLEGVRWNLTTGGEGVWIFSPSISENAGSLSVDDFPRVPGNAAFFLQTQFQKLLMLELNEVAALEREQRLRADNLLKNISLIAAITSHDICNYMQTISIHLDEIALDEGAAGSRSTIMCAHEACELATMLLHSMLSISGHSRDAQTQFSVEATISEIAGLLKALTPENVVFELNLLSPGYEVLGERGGFVSSLLNLVKNASESFDGECGKIVISTLRSPKDTNHVLIKIDDTGPGLPSANIDFQSRDFFTTKRRGTGLGLASVREFCQRSGWTMEIASPAGRGTCILLEAPIHDK